MPNNNRKKIVVIQSYSIGDIVLSTPFFSSLKLNFPDKKIVLICNSKVLSLALFITDIDEVIPYTHNNLLELFHIVKLLRGKCEAVFALNASYLYYIICKLSKTRYFTVSRKYRRYSSYLSDIHETNRYLSILKDAKLCTEATKTVLKIPIQVINEYDKVFSSYISKNSLNIGMVPSASCEAKRWQAEKYASIADWLVDKYNANVIFLGSKSDCAIIDRIKSMMRHYPGDLSGKTTIAGLIYMISKLDYFISNDTGPMQIADALSVPLLAIFGPSNHKRFGPLNTRSKILRENLSCNPCNYNSVHFNCKSFICMDNISVESAKSIISSSLIKLH